MLPPASRTVEWYAESSLPDHQGSRTEPRQPTGGGDPSESDEDGLGRGREPLRPPPQTEQEQAGGDDHDRHDQSHPAHPPLDPPRLAEEKPQRARSTTSSNTT